MVLIEDRPVGGLVQTADAAIAVEGNDQAVTFLCGLFEIAHVPDVQHVEAAVREDHTLSDAAAGIDVPCELIQRANLFGCAAAAGEQIGQNLSAADADDADLLDLQAA